MNKIVLTLFVIFSVLFSAAPALADSNVHITPDPARTNDVLTCYVTYNPSNPAQYDYKWFINGVHASGLDNFYQVPSNYPKIRGESFKCEVREDYGYYGGLQFIGDHTVQIVNSAPVMDTLSQISSSCITGGRSVTISYSGHDDDNDAITYTIIWGDGTSNTVTTSTSATHLYPSAGGTFTITVTANDGQSTSNVLTLPLTFAPCPGPVTYANITLNSRQNNFLTFNLGNTLFNITTYPLPQNLSNIPTGVYPVAYTPLAGFSFVNWLTTGGISVINPTTVNVTGNGNLTAVYQDIQGPSVVFIPPTPSTGTVVNVNCTSNIANTTFSVNVTDNAGNSTANIVSVNLNLNGASYPMTYFSGITWTATIGLTVGTYNYNATAVDSSGNSFTTTPVRMLTVSNSTCGGGVTQYPITLNSVENTGATSNLGTITFNSILFGLPNSTNATAATYTAIYTPSNSSYVFDHWNVTGGLTIIGSNSNPGSIAVAGAGTLTAVYNMTTTGGGGTNYTITLQSVHNVNTSITNLGQTVIQGTAYSLANTTIRTAGSYSTDFINLPGQYTFDHWNVTGSISVANQFSRQTTLTVAGNGTLIAVFKDLVNAPPQMSNIFPSSGTALKVKCSDNKADAKITAIVTDDSGIQSVKVEVNGTNHTMSRSGNTYSLTLQLVAGSYSYKIFARDSNGVEVMSSTRTFTVDDSTCEGGSDSLQVYAMIANDEKADPGEETYVLVRMYNNGNTDIEDIKVKVSIPDFPFTRTIGPFDLSPGWTAKTIYFDVPEDIEPGDYDVKINVYNQDISRTKFRTLTVLGALPTALVPSEMALEPAFYEQPAVKTTSILPLLFAFLLALILLIIALTMAVKLVYESKEL